MRLHRTDILSGLLPALSSAVFDTEEKINCKAVVRSIAGICKKNFLQNGDVPCVSDDYAAVSVSYILDTNIPVSAKCSHGGKPMRLALTRRRGQRMFIPSTYSFNFASVAHFKGCIELEALDEALMKLGKRYPMLIARVLLEESGEACFTDAFARPMKATLVPKTSPDSWIQVTDQALRVRPNFANGPLASCILVQDSASADLILINDHSTADGGSSMLAMHDLLAFLGDPGLELPATSPIPIAQALPDEVLLEIKAMEAAIPPDAPPPDPWPFNAPTHPRQFVPMNLTLDETSRLGERCRAERTSVQGALCAAFISPFVERYPEREKHYAEIPVNLRRFLKDGSSPAHPICTGLAMVEIERAGDLWEMARKAKAAMERAITPKLFIQGQVVNSIVEKMPVIPAFTVDYDLSISNVGRLDWPGVYGKLEFLGLHAPIFNVNQAGHRVMGANTSAGRLHLVYISHDVDAPWLAARGMELLRSMLD